MKSKDNAIYFTSDELMPVSELCRYPKRCVNQVVEDEKRKILTRNGRPVCGLIPLSKLVVNPE